MTRRALWLVLLAALVLAIAAGTWLVATQSGLQWTYNRVRTLVPGELAVETLQGRLIGPLTVRGLRYRSDTLDAAVDRAELDWAPSALLLGRLQIDRLALDGARVRLQESETPPSEDARGVSLPLAVRLADVRLRDIRLERAGQAPYTIESIELAGQLDAEVARIERLHIDTQNFEAGAEGMLGLTAGRDEHLQVRWRVTLPEQPAIAGSGRVTGNLTDIALTQRITEPVAADLRARLRQPLEALTWQLDAELPEFDVRRLGLEQSAHVKATVSASGDRREFRAGGTVHARVPEVPPLAARFRLHGAMGGDIVLEQLTLRVPDTPAQLTAEGRWRPATDAWQAQVHWQELRWPLTGAALVTSPEGTLAASGTLQRYDFRLDAVTLGDNLPRARWRADGSGDRTQVALPTVDIETLDGTLQGSARAAWSPQLRWQAQLRGRALDPAVAWPEWPGRLSLLAEASGDAERMRVNVETLRGTLRGHELTGSALAVRQRATYPTLALALAAGSARINVSGSLTDEWSLSWNVSARELGTLVPQASGRLRGTGRVSGPRAAPLIEAQVSGDGLAYDTTRFEDLTLDVALDLSDRTPSQITLRAAGGSLLNRDFERLGVGATGQLAQHAIAIDLRLPGPSLQAQLQGSYADRTWNGRLRQSVLRIGGVDWKLAGTPALAVGPDRARLDEACWRAGNARLCLELQHTATAGTAFDAAAQGVPLALFAPLLPDTLEVNGTVSGTAQARLEAGRLQTADARFDFSPGTVAVAAPAKTTVRYENAALQLAVDAGGLRADVKIALAQGDGGSAHLELPQFHAGLEFKDQPLDGRVALTLRDLTPLDAILPQLDEMQGALRVDLALAGTPAEPRLRGEAVLADAAATIPAAGIRVHDVRLTASARGADAIELSGQARSGGGQLGLSGRITFPDDPPWRAELRIAGTQFQAANLREAQVYVSPDLHVRIAPGEIRVTGEVRIPKATFALRQPREGAITPSPDVVVVNAPDAPARQQRWNIRAEVRVILGDDVRFTGFGLNGKVGGDLLLVEAPGQATTARGELRVAAGEYEAYGQTLQVERGRLLFVGGPVGNPGIDARAVRQVDNITVGVEVKGTLRSPELSLFSDPAMGQADALSYLLFGRPLERTTSSEGRSLAAAARALKLAGGERLARWLGARFGIEEVEIETGNTPETAALVLGKQLSPRLYINYSIGLFEPANVLRLRYQLSPHWSLEAQSGESAGGDLLFTIER